MKKRFILSYLLILFFFSNVKAQNWGGGIDQERLSFGYSFQYIASEYKILKNPNWSDPFSDPTAGLGKLKSIYSNVTPGVGLMLLAKYKLTDYIDFRISPSYVFGNDLKMNYAYELLSNIDSVEIVKKTNKSSLVEFPINLKLKSQRFGNVSVYMLGGVKYSMDISSRKSLFTLPEKQKNLIVKRNYLSYEAGLGLDFYFKWFKVSPELKLSYSLKDMIDRQGSAFDNPIEKAKLRSFTFSLIFQ